MAISRLTCEIAYRMPHVAYDFDFVVPYLASVIISTAVSTEVSPEWHHQASIVALQAGIDLTAFSNLSSTSYCL